MNIKPLLAEAEKFLTENPRDHIHDLAHHQRVWENAQLILQSLNQQVDRDVLQVATMWHDVMLSQKSLNLGNKGLLQETIQFLQQSMIEKQYPIDFQKKVLDAIKHHNFLTRFQVNTEGKILFDADKLDALHPLRYRKIISALESKKINPVQISLLTKTAKLWLKTMRKRYHFEKSRELHDSLISEILKDKKALKMAKAHGVDVEKLVR